MYPSRQWLPALLANEEVLLDRHGARLNGLPGDEIVQLMRFFVAV